MRQQNEKRSVCVHTTQDLDPLMSPLSFPDQVINEQQMRESTPQQRMSKRMFHIGNK